MSDVEDEVHETFKPKWVDVKEVIPKLKKMVRYLNRGLTRCRI